MAMQWQYLFDFDGSQRRSDTYAAHQQAEQTRIQNAKNAKLQKELLASSAQSVQRAENNAISAARETNAFNASQAAINRDFQQASSNAAMAFEAEQNQKAMDFSERMSNTTYQRAISDLKAAGLSPLLAYGSLQTSAPSGSAGSGVSASGSAASGVKADVNSAVSAENSVRDTYYDLLALNINSALSLKSILNNYDLGNRSLGIQAANIMLQSSIKAAAAAG